MNTNASLLKVVGIEVTVLHKNVKNLHLNVLPPDGKVRVTAPNRINEDAIRTFLITRLSWIKKKQQNFKNQERQTPRKYKSGESHYFLGKRYKLVVKENAGKSGIQIKGKKEIILTIKRDSSVLYRERVINDFYRNELKQILTPLMQKWQDKIKVKPNFWGIRKMKTRWGTCDNKKKNIWFNLELIKKPDSCIQYVVVHELAHLLERKHNDKFVSLLDQFLPKWRHEKDELNQFILSHEKWNY